MKKVSILGATGSIGTSTIDVLNRHPEKFAVRAVTAYSNVQKLADAAKKTNAEVAVIGDAKLFGKLQEALNARQLKTIAKAGEKAIVEEAADPDAEIVVGAIVGAAGIASTFASAKAGKRLLLANKESVVCGGRLLMDTIKAYGAQLLPVDSEHNAVFQCLESASEKMRQSHRIILTASGGPFRKRMDLSTVTVEEATHHPNWSMGKKITVDSATLMNKGLEVIEARWLFDTPEDRIDVVVHPQSIIHSMVQYEDGVVLAQLGAPDMRNTIAYCLGYPERLNAGVKPLDFSSIHGLTFEKPDTKRFPQLAYAYEALRRGGCSCIMLNAVNEIAVENFLKGKIRFIDIPKICEVMMLSASEHAPKSLEDVLEADKEARILTQEYISGYTGE